MRVLLQDYMSHIIYLFCSTISYYYNSQVFYVTASDCNLQIYLRIIPTRILNLIHCMFFFLLIVNFPHNMSYI